MPTVSAEAAVRWMPRILSSNGPWPFDQPHSIKLNTVYELPFGEGALARERHRQSDRGGWRVAVIQAYSSGFPIAVTSNAARCRSSTGPTAERDGYRLACASRGATFDPNVDKFLNRAAFVQRLGPGQCAAHQSGRARLLELSENVSWPSRAG